MELGGRGRIKLKRKSEKRRRDMMDGRRGRKPENGDENKVQYEVMIIGNFSL